MKICSKCGQLKDLSDFFIRDKQSGKLHAQCKICYRDQRTLTYKDHYQKYRELYLTRAKSRRLAIRTNLHKEMITYLSDKTCVLCSESDAVVLEFDHRDPSKKRFSISSGIRYGYDWSIILDEIKKCRVLCANCHKRHTAQQSNWYKLK